jgi:hypothetical protein
MERIWVEPALRCRDGSSALICEPKSGIDGIAADGPGAEQGK